MKNFEKIEAKFYLLNALFNYSNSFKKSIIIARKMQKTLNKAKIYGTIQ